MLSSLSGATIGETNLFFHVLLSGGKLPTRGLDSDGRVADGDAVGYDLYAPSDGFIDPLERKLVKLGFSAAFTPGYVGKLFDKSGIAHKHGLASLAGVIDPSYRGEWGLILYNSSRNVYRFSAGDRLGQVLFWKVELPEVCQVYSLDETARGAGGYGSMGK